MNLSIGLPLVIASVALLNWSFYGQHAASATLPRLSLRHPVAAMWSLLSNRRWLVSYGAGWVGWAAYIAALRFAPLSVVQALSASGIGLLALADHRLRARLARRGMLGAGFAVAGLLLVIISLAHPTAGRNAGELVLLLVVGVGLVAAAAAAAAPRRVLARGAALGSAAGICFGIGDVATKGALAGGGPLFVPIFLACSAIGFVALQLAYQRGSVLETAGVSSLLTNAIPIAAGVVVFAESPPSGVLGAARIAGFALALLGGVLLARPPDAPPIA